LVDRDLWLETAQRACVYRDTIAERAVTPSAGALAALQRLDVPLPEGPADPAEVLRVLDEIGSPATVATTGGRFFGFVIGGSLPAAVAADWLASAWDQNAGLQVASPIAAALEHVCSAWLLDILGLPPGAGVGFVSGATMANCTAMAAARHAVLAAQGWDVEAQGLIRAPPLQVIVGDEVHVSLLEALALLGLGIQRTVRVPVDGQGRLRPDALPELTGSTILCLQAGNVNTGAFDPAEELCRRAHEVGAWVHVDGAFGLWAAAAPARAPLCRGVAEADSWATDAHKYLNVPYDSGLVIVRDPRHLRAAMTVRAAYLLRRQQAEPSDWVPELSRRARVVPIWAALMTLGRSGVADLVERTCNHAAFFAAGLAGAGYQVLNEVVLNQVLVSFGDDDLTRRVVAGAQADGTCWCGGTVWQGRTAMRISVSSWATTQDDCERSLAAILRVARAVA